MGPKYQMAQRFRSFLAKPRKVSDNGRMHSAKAAAMVLVAFCAACGSNGTSSVKTDSGTPNADARSDGPASTSDLPIDNKAADAPTATGDLAAGDHAGLADVGAIEVASVEVSTGIDAALDTGESHDLALAMPDAEEFDLPPLGPGQCRLSADCLDPAKRFCSRSGLCVVCEWNQQCRDPNPYCVDNQCMPSPTGWLDASDDVDDSHDSGEPTPDA